MVLNECVEGYRILSSAFNKKLKNDEIEKFHQYFFINRDSKQFISACKVLSEKGEKFPNVSEILREMEDVTIEYKVEERDWNTVTGMPPKLRALLDKMKDDKDIDRIMDEANGIDGDDLPF